MSFSSMVPPTKMKEEFSLGKHSPHATRTTKSSNCSWCFLIVLWNMRSWKQGAGVKIRPVSSGRMVHGAFQSASFFNPTGWGVFRMASRPSLHKMIGSPTSHHRTLRCVSWRNFMNAKRYLTLDLGNKNKYPAENSPIPWKMSVERLKFLLGGPGFCPMFHPGVNLRVQRHLHSNTQVGNLYIYSISISICVCTPALRLYYCTWHFTLYPIQIFFLNAWPFLPTPQWIWQM